MKKVRSLLLTLLVLVLAAPAQAGLLGSTVDAAAYFPTSSTLFLDPGVRVVGPGVEYPVGSYGPSYNATLSIDITDGQLILSIDPTFFVSAAFNGIELHILSGSVLISAIADAASQFNPVISIVGNTLFLNYQGITVGPNRETSIIDIVTRSTGTVPEPGSLALLATALASLSLYRRRQR